MELCSTAAFVFVPAAAWTWGIAGGVWICLDRWINVDILNTPGPGFFSHGYPLSMGCKATVFASGQAAEDDGTAFQETG